MRLPLHQAALALLEACAGGWGHEFAASTVREIQWETQLETTVGETVRDTVGETVRETVRETQWARR